MKDNNYNLGLVSLSFRGHTPREISEAARDAGLSFIEWGSDVHAPCRDRQRLYEIAELQKEYRIFCSSYGTYFRLGVTPIEELRDYIFAAKILGTDILRLWCSAESGADMTDAERDALLRECCRAAKIAEAEGVTLCLECHKNTFTERLSDALWLMREVGSEHFLTYWQPFQWKSEEENLTYAETIAPYTRHIHVFQWKGEERLSLAEGICEWRDYLKKFPTPRTLLLEFMPDGNIGSLRIEADALRRIIGGLE